MRVRLSISPVHGNRVFPVNYKYKFSAWVYITLLELLLHTSKVRLKELQLQLTIKLYFNSSNEGSINKLIACIIRKIFSTSNSVIFNGYLHKMKPERIIKILEIFKEAEKGLDKESPEFKSLPKERVEFYFSLLEDDFEFIRKFQDSGKNVKYRITAKGYDFFNRKTKAQNPIGF